MYTQGKEGEIDSHYDALQAVLSSIPEELYHEIELEISAAEGAATNKQRLEVLKEQQELIDAEAAQHSHNETEAARKEKEAEFPKEEEVTEEKEKVEAKATEVKK